MLDEINDSIERIRRMKDRVTCSREFCSVCHGMGHSPSCDCHTGVDFVMGCCSACGGEGMVPKRPMVSTGLILS